MIPQLRRYLLDTLGLDLESIGLTRVQEAVLRAQQEAGCREEELPAHLEHHEEQRQRFYESLTVPETWFLRGRPALSHLADFAIRRISVPQHPAASLRVLSIPCSTGEEPYSVLMMLDMAGFPLDRVEVHGADISATALAVARQAAYTSYSFRGVEPGITSRYFTEHDKLRLLHPALRDRVRFFQANAVAPDFLPGHPPYDIILCRNLLIYLLPSAREILLNHFNRLLHINGLLLAGHSEVAAFLSHGWHKIDAPHAFAFQHPHATPAKKAIPTPRSSPSRQKIKNPPPPGKPRSTPHKTTPSTPAPHVVPGRPVVPKQPTPTTEPNLPSLNDIRLLADAGRLQDATQACDLYMKNNPLDAEGFCLAGLVQAALGHDRDAIRFLERALYINPTHEETLIHLALLYSASGDKQKADRCRRRLS